MSLVSRRPLVLLSLLAPAGCTILGDFGSYTDADEVTVGDGDGDGAGDGDGDGTGGGDGDGDGTGGGDGDGDGTGGGDGDGDGDGDSTGGAGDGDGDLGTGGQDPGSGGSPGSGGDAPGGGGTANTGGMDGSGGAAMDPDGCPEQSWTVSDSYASNGTICGPVSVLTYGSVTPDPPCDQGECFADNEICVSGTIPADDGSGNYSGVVIHWDIRKDGLGWLPEGTGLRADLDLGGLDLVDLFISAGGFDYCASVAPFQEVPWSSFVTNCWDNTASHEGYDGSFGINNIRVGTIGNPGEQQLNGLCIREIVAYED